MANTSSTIYSATWNSDLDPVDAEELWGQLGAFTTMKLEIKGRHRCAYFKKKHIARLLESMRILDINCPFLEQWIANTLEAVIKSIEDKGLYRIRLMVTASKFSIFVIRTNDPEMHIKGIVWEYKRSNPEAKSLDYQDILEALGGIDRNKEELILQSEDGLLLEGATTNLLFVKGNEIITPKADRLNGITLGLLKELLKADFNIVEENVHALSINEFDEILCCGSGRGVSAFIEIESLNWNTKSVDAFRTVRLRYDNACIDHKYED